MEEKPKIVPAAVSTRNAATYTGWSVSYLVRSRSVDTGPAFIKNGKKIMYLIEDLDIWLRQNRREG